MEKRKSIVFYEHGASRILKTVLSQNNNGVFAVTGTKGTGKSHIFEQILSLARSNKIRILNLQTKKIINSNFVLQLFCNELTNALAPFIKDIKPTVDFDFRSIEKILKLDFAPKSNLDKDIYRKPLVEYLMLLDYLMKEYNVKIILAYDELESFEQNELIKIFQIARYVKNYLPALNLILFFDRDKLCDSFKIPNFEDVKKEFFNSVISIDNSWDHYELDNKLVYSFIQQMQISNKSVVIELLRRNEMAKNFMTYRFKKNIHSNFLGQLTTEAELITFALNYISIAEPELFQQVIYSIMAFHLIKDEPRYVAVEYRNEDNKAMFSKVRALIEFFHSKIDDYFDKNKFAAIVYNINYPYNLPWQIFFTNEYDEERIPENNMNCYMSLLLVFSNIKFWESKEKKYWFRIETDTMPRAINILFDLLVEQRQLFHIPTIEDKLFFYQITSDFILYYAKSFIKNGLGKS
jgi:hypothetical protein